MPILSSLSVLGAHFSTPSSGSPWYADSSSAHHTVTLNGAVTQSDEGGGVKAALFDGNGDLKTASDSAFDLSSGNSTIEFWINTVTPAYQSVVYGQVDDNPPNLHIHNYVDGNLHVNNGHYTDAIIALTYNAWQHVAVVINEGAKFVYKNGILESTTSQLWGQINKFVFGGGIGFGSNNFNGKLAALRIVKGTAIYTSNFSVPTTLPTAVSGTELLLNFGATAVPTV